MFGLQSLGSPQRHRTVVPPLQTSVPNHGSTIVREAFFSLAGISGTPGIIPVNMCCLLIVNVYLPVFLLDSSEERGNDNHSQNGIRFAIGVKQI